MPSASGISETPTLDPGIGRAREQVHAIGSRRGSEELRKRVDDPMGSSSCLGLAVYIVEKSGRHPDSVGEDSRNAGERKVLRLIEEVWANANWREYICQAARRKDRGREWLSILIAVGDDLSLWENWPELHDVRQLFPDDTFRYKPFHDVPRVFPEGSRRYKPLSPTDGLNLNQALASRVASQRVMRGPTYR